MERKEKDFDVFSLKRLCKFPLIRRDKKGQESGPVQMTYQLKKALFGPCDPFPVMEIENGKRPFKVPGLDLFCSGRYTGLTNQMASPFFLTKLTRRFPMGLPRTYVWFRAQLLCLDVIDRLVPQEGKILDIGCGFGIVTLSLALGSPKRELIGFELDPKRIRLARNAAAGLPQVSFEERDFSTDPSLPDGVDAIVMIDLLHHVPFQVQEKLLDQCALHLRQGGSLCIREIDTTPKRKFYWNLLHDKIVTGNQSLYFRPSEEFQKQLERRGLSVRRWSHPHPLYPFVFLLGTKQNG